MSENSYAYQAGRDAGAALLEPGLSLAAVLAKVEEDTAAQRVPLEIRVVECRKARELSAERLARATGKAERARTKRDELQRLVERHPAKFSWRRGTLYLVAAIVLLAAEYTLLAQILGQVLNLSRFAEGGSDELGPLGVLLFGDTEAFTSLVELFVATAGVLALTVALKAVADSYPPVTGSQAEDISTQKRVKVPQVIGTVVVLAIVVAALARMWLDFGEVESGAAATGGTGIRMIATIIGLACPLAGYLLFTSAVDALSNRVRLLGVRWRLRCLTYVADKIRKEHSARCVECERAELEQSLTNVLPQTRARTTDDFRRGFNKGLQEVFEMVGQPGGYRGIRRLVSGADATTFPLTARLPGDA